MIEGFINNKFFRKQLIKKLEKGSNRIESDPETNKKQLETLKRWKELTPEEKKAFIEEIENDPNYFAGMQKGQEVGDKIKSAPGKGFRAVKNKIKSVFRDE